MCWNTGNFRDVKYKATKFVQSIIIIHVNQPLLSDIFLHFIVIHIVVVISTPQ